MAEMKHYTLGEYVKLLEEKGMLAEYYLQAKEGEESKAFKEVQYVYDNGKEKVDVKVEKAPQKAVTLSQFMTEMYLNFFLMIPEKLLRERC